MKLSRRSALAIALVAGVLAAVTLYMYVGRATGRRMPRPEMVEVVIAAADISAQSVIKPGQLATQKRGRNETPRGAAMGVEVVAGRVALANLPQGQVIRTDQIADPGPALGLAHVVPDHMRAVTVAIDAISGVAGFLKPGNRVDVLATIEVDDVTVTLTVLQNVELLALGQQAQPTPEDRPKVSGRPARADTQTSATLAVTPEQAQRLFLAESKGALRLALRSVEDDRRIDIAKAIDWEITGIPPKPRQAPTASRPPATAQQPYAGAYPPWWYEGTVPPEAAEAAMVGSFDEIMEPSQIDVEVMRGSEREVVIVNE